MLLVCFLLCSVGPFKGKQSSSGKSAFHSAAGSWKMYDPTAPAKFPLETALDCSPPSALGKTKESEACIEFFLCFLEGEQDLLHKLWTGSELVPGNTKMGRCPPELFWCSHFLGLTWFPKLRFQDLPQMLLPIFHLPQTISWEWELIRESGVTLALTVSSTDAWWQQRLIQTTVSLFWLLRTLFPGVSAFP